MRSGRFRTVAVLLALAVVAVYGQTYRHGFLSYDDDTYITANPEVTGGLSLRGVGWALRAHAQNWHPLTWLSHMLDAQVFGAWPGGPHLVSAGLHAANAVLLLAVLAALTGSFWRSAAVAAVFALHPLRVESVAWAAERKDVLAALVWMLTLAAYLRYARRPGTGRYLATFGLLALGLMAKPMLVTLPFVLLLLDWWPLGRLSRPGGGGRSPGRLLAEKAPLLLLSAASALVTLQVQTAGNPPLVEAGLTTRLSNAAVSVLLYLRSFVWPVRLAPLYPYPRQGIPWEAAAGALAVLLLVCAAAVLLRRRQPALLVGWLWFLGTLLPVSGIVQLGAQSRADRYTYLTMIGCTVALVWLSAGVRPRRPGVRAALGTAAAAWAVALAVASARYVPVWRDDLSLFGYAVRVTEDNVVMLNNYGIALSSAGRSAQARDVLVQALRLEPGLCGARFVLGSDFSHEARWADAAAAFEGALRCFVQQGADPRLVGETHASLGACYKALGRWTEAEGHYRALRQLDPENSRARDNLRWLPSRQGRR